MVGTLIINGLLIDNDAGFFARLGADCGWEGLLGGVRERQSIASVLLTDHLFSLS